MGNRPAKFTQADIGRAIKAAMAAGAAAVILQADGTIRIELQCTPDLTASKNSDQQDAVF